MCCLFFQFQAFPSAWSSIKQAGCGVCQPGDSGDGPVVSPAVMQEEDGAWPALLAALDVGESCSAGGCVPGALPPRLRRTLTSGTRGMKGAVETRVLLMPWKVASRN